MCSCVKEEYDQILKGTNNTRITAWWDEAIAFGDGKNDIEMLENFKMQLFMITSSNKVINGTVVIISQFHKDINRKISNAFFVSRIYISV